MPKKLSKYYHHCLAQVAREREREREMELSCSSTLMASSLLPSKPSIHYASLASFNSLFTGTGNSLSKSRLSLVSGRRRRAPPPPPSSRRLGCRCLFGLGVPELVVIAGVAALVFGPKNLPEVGRSIGKTVKSFQQAAKEFETELKKEPEDANNIAPPTEIPKPVSGDHEKKELEASGTKEST